MGSLEADERANREALATTVRHRYRRHFAMRRAIQRVRGMSELEMLHKGGHLNRSLVDPDLALLARSFAGIYVLVVVFEGPFDEVRARHAITHALPAIESLVLALPPRDPPPNIAGAKAARRPVRR
jgi:hypothetical protein